MTKNNTDVKPKHVPLYTNTDDFIDKVLLGAMKWSIHPQKHRLCDAYGKYIKEPDLYILQIYDKTHKADRVNIALDRVMPLIQFRIHKIREEMWRNLCMEIHGGDEFESHAEMDRMISIIVPDSENSIRTNGVHAARNKLKYLLLNFIKQIKHKLILEEDLDYPVVPIFYGAQGIAKSKLVRFLTDPFGVFVKKMSVEQITDVNRFYRFLRDKVVIRIEELDGADKANLAMLKSIVTDNEITAQKYYSQVPIEEFCFATFIITSNKRSSEVFRDRSGNRRWGDFEIMTEIDLNKFKDIDMMKIIRGIKLNDTEAEREKMRLMSEKFLIPDQNECRVQDDIDEFIEELEIKVSSVAVENEFISKEELYTTFEDYWKRQLRPYPKDLTKRKFWISLKDHLKIAESFSKVKEKTVRGIRIDMKTYRARHMVVINSTCAYK